jgi:hypothetical protein
MIEFVDMALWAFFKEVFLNRTIEWGDPKVARKILARGDKNSDTGGLPGMVLYRTAAPVNTDQFSMTRASGLPGGGMPAGRLDPSLVSDPLNFRDYQAGTRPPTDELRQSGAPPTNTGLFNNIRQVPVRATYDTMTWCRSMSDQNYFERLLSFCSIYQAVHATIQGNDFRFYMYAGDSDYERDLDEETGRINYYGMGKVFYVDTFWILTRADPMVESIKVQYQKMINGEPVDLESLQFSVQSPFNQRP